MENWDVTGKSAIFVGMNGVQVKNGGRVPYLDLMKGVAIFLVVMGHVIAMCIRGLDRAFIFKLIEQTHMPIFFFVSGFLTYKAGFRAPNLRKRLLQLIVPMLVITPLWVWYFPHSGLQSPLSNNLPDLYRSYWKDGYWFPLCLFELFLLYWPLSQVLARIKSFAGQVVVLVVAYAALIALSLAFSDEAANTDYLGLGLLARFFPVFMIGVMARKAGDAFQQLLHNPWAISVTMLVTAVALFAMAYPWDALGDDPAVWSGAAFAIRPVLHLGIAMLVIRLVEPWAASQMPADATVRPNAVTRYFNLLGNESLGIYLLHYFFLFPLTVLQEPLNAMSVQFLPMALVSALLAVPITGITLLLIALLKHSPLTSRLFLGK